MVGIVFACFACFAFALLACFLACLLPFWCSLVCFCFCLFWFVVACSFDRSLICLSALLAFVCLLVQPLTCLLASLVTGFLACFLSPSNSCPFIPAPWRLFGPTEPPCCIRPNLWFHPHEPDQCNAVGSERGTTGRS